MSNYNIPSLFGIFVFIIICVIAVTLGIVWLWGFIFNEDEIVSKNRNLQPYKNELIIENGKVDTIYYYKGDNYE